VDFFFLFLFFYFLLFYDKKKKKKEKRSLLALKQNPQNRHDPLPANQSRRRPSLRLLLTFAESFLFLFLSLQRVSPTILFFRFDSLPTCSILPSLVTYSPSQIARNKYTIRIYVVVGAGHKPHHIDMFHGGDRVSCQKVLSKIRDPLLVSQCYRGGS
jgi:hypothetical protein